MCDVVKWWRPHSHPTYMDTATVTLLKELKSVVETLHGGTITFLAT